MFLDCPAYLDEEGALRCGLPAEVKRRFTMRSSDGPLEAAMIRCPSGHWFNGPIEFLAPEKGRSTIRAMPKLLPAPGVTRSSAFTMATTAGQVRRAGIHRAAGAGNPLPNGAPAYYLGRPACLWITVMSSRSRRSTSNQLMGWGTTCQV